MKIVSIMGSPRIKGNTHKILSAFEDEISAFSEKQNTPVEISRINLAEKNILQCRGCRICFDLGEGKCPLKDDILNIKSKMDGADAFIFASPVFVEDVPGILKNFIDRLAFVCHRPSFFGKSALILSTSGVFSSGHELKTASRALALWGAGVSHKESFKAGASLGEGEASMLYGEKTKKLAKKFVRSIVSHKAPNPSFLSLLKFCVQQKYWLKKTEDSLDLAYWQDSGMLDKKTKYPSDITSSKVKIFFARLAGGIIARFVV